MELVYPDKVEKEPFFFGIFERDSNTQTKKIAKQGHSIMLKGKIVVDTKKKKLSDNTNKDKRRKTKSEKITCIF